MVKGRCSDIRAFCGGFLAHVHYFEFKIQKLNLLSELSLLSNGIVWPLKISPHRISLTLKRELNVYLLVLWMVSQFLSDFSRIL